LVALSLSLSPLVSHSQIPIFRASDDKVGI